MAKVINAVFGGGLFATTAKVFQYDVGDKLRFLGIDLPAGYSVDFANSRSGASTTVYGDADGVEIPPAYFIPGTEIYAWLVISDADGHYTRYQAKIPIYERASRTSVEPTPAQADALDEAINALNSAVEDVEDIADGIPDQIDTALAEAKASGEFDGPPGPQGDAYVLTAADREEIAGIASDDVLVVSDTEPTVEPLPKIWIDSDDDGTIEIPTMEDIGDLDDLVTTAKDNLVAAINEAAQSGGGGGTGDYDDLANQPQINGTTLSGNKTAAQLGLAPAGAYVKPSGGIPASDLASGVIPTVPTKTSDLTNDSGFVNAAGAAAAAPVQSVNGKTGAVSLSIPSTAADVGAVAVAQGTANANKIMTVGPDGLVVPEDDSFVVTLTPTAQDFSGMMDKTVAEINAAWEAGKEIWFRIYAGTAFTDVPCDRVGKANLTYPSFNAAMLYDEENMFVLIYTGTTSDGSKQTYSTKLYPLATGQWTGGSY